MNIKPSMLHVKYAGVKSAKFIIIIAKISQYAFKNLLMIDLPFIVKSLYHIFCYFANGKYWYLKFVFLMFVIDMFAFELDFIAFSDILLLLNLIWCS